MKKLFLFLIITSFTSNLNAQEEYGEFLDNAIEAAAKYEVKEYNTNMKYFITALERDSVTPETLPQEFFDKYLECVNVGFLYQIDLSEEFEKLTYRFAQYGAQQENPKAMYMLGYLYSGGKFTEHNQEETIKWYKKAAEKGNPFAMRHLGGFYSLGIYGLSKDAAEGQKWLDNALQTFLVMEKKDSSDLILFGLADYYSLIYHTVSKRKEDLEQAEKWTMKLVERGNIMGMANLAGIYFTKFQTDQNTENLNQGIAWAEKAAEKNSPTGILMLGTLLWQKGEKQEAVNWFTKGCNLGQQTNCSMKQVYESQM